MFNGIQGHIPEEGLIRPNRPIQPFPGGQIGLFGPLRESPLYRVLLDYTAYHEFLSGSLDLIPSGP